MEEKPAESFHVSKTEKPLNERRVALIAVLISIPSAFLIAMLIHFFVAIPEQGLFSSETVIIPPQEYNAHRPKRPARMQKPAGKQTGRLALADLYKKKIELCTANLNDAEKSSKSGIEVLDAKCALLLAEGELFRFENKIRRWGNSVSDLAVRTETAKQKAAQLKDKTSAISAIDLEILLKSHRIFRNEDWQKSYEEYLKNPCKKTYLAMLETEQAAQPPRRF